MALPLAGVIDFATGCRLVAERGAAMREASLERVGTMAANDDAPVSTMASNDSFLSGGLRLELDAHHSTAESGANNPYGTSTSVGTAIFGVASQTVDYTNDLPVISVDMHDGIDPFDAGNIQATGNAFRNAYFKDRINEDLKTAMKTGEKLRTEAIRSIRASIIELIDRVLVLDQGKLVAQGPKSDFMKKPPSSSSATSSSDPISTLEGRTDPGRSEKFGYGAAA